MVAKNRAWISAYSGTQLILAELVALLVLNVISPVTGGGQEEDCHKLLSGHILILFSLVHPRKAHCNNPDKYTEDPQIITKQI